MSGKERQELRKIFALARDGSELEALLDGLLTPQECEEFVKRWRLLERLAQGVPQRTIARELGVSLGTISRGSRLLKYGPAKFRALVRRSTEAGNGTAPAAEPRDPQ
jgi:Trp operon repressor